MVVYHELVLFRMQISSIAETTNVSILHSEPRNFFQLEKYFRVVKRSSLSHRKQIRMCFLQEQFINVPSKASVQKKWPLLGFFLFSPRQEHKLIMLIVDCPAFRACTGVREESFSVTGVRMFENGGVKFRR